MGVVGTVRPGKLFCLAIEVMAVRLSCIIVALATLLSMESSHVT